MGAEFKMRITADSKQFGDEVRQVVGKLNEALPAGVSGLLGRVTGALTSPLGAITALTSAIAGLYQYSIGKASALQKLATGAELSTTQVQALSLASHRFGIEPEELLSQLEIIKQKQGELADGNVEVARTFDILGFSKEKALEADPFDIMLKIFEDTKKGEGGMRAFAAAVSLLGRTFRSELAPLARRGLGDAIKGYAESDLITPERTVQRLAEQRAAQRRTQAELEAAAQAAGLRFTDALTSPIETLGQKQAIQLEQENPAVQRYLADQEKKRAEKFRQDRISEVRATLQATEDRRINEAAAKLQETNAAKIAEHQFDSLSSAEKRLAMEKEIAKIQFNLEHDKYANELEVQQATARMLDLQHATAAGNLRGLPEPDQFARMGLFLTAGTQNYSAMFALQKETNRKLDKIDNSIRTLGREIPENL